MASSTPPTPEQDAELLARIVEPLANGNWGRLGYIAKTYGKNGLRVVSAAVASGRLERRGRTKTTEYRLIPEPAPRVAPVLSAQSLRSAIVEVIRERGVTGSVSLTEALRKRGYAARIHEVQHLLGALKHDGILTYVETMTGNQKTLVNIRLQANGKSPEPAPEERWPVPTAMAQKVAEAEAAGVPTLPEGYGIGIQGRVTAEHDENGVRVIDGIDLIGVSILRPPVDRFPLLTRLLRRRSLVEQAANALSEAGLDEEAVRLLDLPLPTSPIEVEYMAYVATHPDGAE
jgi:hypothetical protein